MQVVDPSFDIVWLIDPKKMLQHVERCAKKCYQSTHTITDESYKIFIGKLIDSGHESTIEHMSITVDIICDRGVTHEIVRHRLCAFSQESTRYCNYTKDKFGNEIKVINPFFFDPLEDRQDVFIPDFNSIQLDEFSPKSGLTLKLNSFDVWLLTCLYSEWGYNTLIQTFKRTAQEARSVLPNSLKTEISVTANLREWRHILKLRCDKVSHPQMRQIMIPLLKEFNEYLPEVFNDIYNKYGNL